ncbi:MAG: phosphate acyltransferase [Planctomycetota bacterium]
MQVDVAVEPERFRDLFGERIPDSEANVLIFPNLHAANAAWRLSRVIGDGTAIGPMLLGLKRPANVLARGSTSDEIFNMLAVTAYNAERRKIEMAEGTKTRVWRVGGSEPVQVMEGEVR